MKTTPKKSRTDLTGGKWGRALEARISVEIEALRAVSPDPIRHSDPGGVPARVPAIQLLFLLEELDELDRMLTDERDAKARTEVMSYRETRASVADAILIGAPLVPIEDILRGLFVLHGLADSRALHTGEELPRIIGDVLFTLTKFAETNDVGALEQQLGKKWRTHRDVTFAKTSVETMITLHNRIASGLRDVDEARGDLRIARAIAVYFAGSILSRMANYKWMPQVRPLVLAQQFDHAAKRYVRNKGMPVSEDEWRTFAVTLLRAGGVEPKKARNAMFAALENEAHLRKGKRGSSTG